MKLFSRRAYLSTLFFFAAVCLARGVWALDADQLALVANRNMPESVKLAEFYAQARGVPDHRIIELDLPTTENISFDEYERKVVPPIREFLRLHDPDRKIKCLVTFYGVPFRIDAHNPTPAELAEGKQMAEELHALEARLSVKVDELEKTATAMDPAFKPSPPPLGEGAGGAVLVDELLRRAENAGRSMSKSIEHIADPAQHQAAVVKMLALAQGFATPSPDNDPPPTSGPADDMDPATFPEDRRYDPAVRSYFRRRAAKSGGMFGYARLLVAQLGYLNPQDSEAALDNELAMLWVSFYPRSRWQMNSLCYRFASTGGPPPLYVSRLDAPEPKTVREMILASIRAEQQGLRGRVVIDSRGLLPGPNGQLDEYGKCDQALRNLAGLVREKTTMPLTLDEKPEVLPPHSVQDVAVYVGWYSVGKYVPACSFVPGAVGYHIASFEMTSLRDNANTGWVRGLLNDGVSATLGPVSEPYLQAFPPADDFFPLLLTGRLTLAEVYWRTELMTSWRICLVGDPLYTPFKLNPALRVEDLPPRLKPIFGVLPSSSANSATTAPAGRP